MELQTFNQTVNDKRSFSHYLGYISSGVFLILGLFITTAVGGVGLIFVVMGCIGLYRTYIEVRIIKIASDKTISQKVDIIKHYIKSIKAYKSSVNSNYIIFDYRTELFNYVEILVLCDSDYFYINTRKIYLGRERMWPSLVSTRAIEKITAFINSSH